VSRAELEYVGVDLDRASALIDQARRFLVDADGDVSLESAVVLYWNACINSMDAILAAAGQRVGTGEDSHIVRVEAIRDILGSAANDLCDRLDEWRGERHDVSYRAVTPSEADVAAMQADARDILAETKRYVSSQRGSGS
jgi:hypothetical protein